MNKIIFILFLFFVIASCAKKDGSSKKKVSGKDFSGRYENIAIECVDQNGDTTSQSEYDQNSPEEIMTISGNSISIKSTDNNCTATLAGRIVFTETELDGTTSGGTFVLRTTSSKVSPGNSCTQTATYNTTSGTALAESFDTITFTNATLSVEQTSAYARATETRNGQSVTILGIYDDEVKVTGRPNDLCYYLYQKL